MRVVFVGVKFSSILECLGEDTLSNAVRSFMKSVR